MNFGPAESAFSIFHASGRSEDVSVDGVGWGKPSSCAIAELALAISKETATILAEAIGAIQWSTRATKPDWEKWGPSDPTSPHCYDVPRLARLIGANIARAQDHHEPVKTVRDFVAEFRGFSPTQHWCARRSARRVCLSTSW